MSSSDVIEKRTLIFNLIFKRRSLVCAPTPVLVSGTIFSSGWIVISSSRVECVGLIVGRSVQLFSTSVRFFSHAPPAPPGLRLSASPLSPGTSCGFGPWYRCGSLIPAGPGALRNLARGFSQTGPAVVRSLVRSLEACSGTLTGSLTGSLTCSLTAAFYLSRMVFIILSY